MERSDGTVYDAGRRLGGQPRPVWCLAARDPSLSFWLVASPRLHGKVVIIFGLAPEMWFDGWEPVARTVIQGSIGYVALVAILRVSGKRTLSKMNAFDFVITIALGSVFASLVISDSVSLAQGVTALALLVGLQWIVSALYVRSRLFESVIKGSPQLLYWRGEFLDDALERERVTPDEVKAAMRESNVTDHDRAAAILETDGSITVIDPDERTTVFALENVRRN